MKDRYFFEVPVYRCSPDDYESELKHLQEKIETDLEPQKRALPDYDFSNTQDELFRIAYYDFDYNEVIGWIKLFILGNQVRGEYFFEVSANYPHSRKKRINRGVRKKRFAQQGKAFEMSVYNDMSSKQIFTEIVSNLNYLSGKERPFKGRYIDLRQFLEIGPYVDWKNLVNDLNPYKRN